MENKMKFNFISKYVNYSTKVEVEKDKYVEVNFQMSSFATNDGALAAAIRKHPYFGVEIHEDKAVKQPEPVKEPETPKAPETPVEPAKPEETSKQPEPETPKAAAAKKTFQCEKCKSKFASQTALEAHITAMHE